MRLPLASTFTKFFPPLLLNNRAFLPSRQCICFSTAVISQNEKQAEMQSLNFRLANLIKENKFDDCLRLFAAEMKISLPQTPLRDQKEKSIDALFALAHYLIMIDELQPGINYFSIALLNAAIAKYKNQHLSTGYTTEEFFSIFQKDKTRFKSHLQKQQDHPLASIKRKLFAMLINLRHRNIYGALKSFESALSLERDFAACIFMYGDLGDMSEANRIMHTVIERFGEHPRKGTLNAFIYGCFKVKDYESLDKVFSILKPEDRHYATVYAGQLDLEFYKIAAKIDQKCVQNSLEKRGLIFETIEDQVVSDFSAELEEKLPPIDYADLKNITTRIYNLIRIKKYSEAILMYIDVVKNGKVIVDERLENLHMLALCRSQLNDAAELFFCEMKGKKRVTSFMLISLIDMYAKQNDVEKCIYFWDHFDELALTRFGVSYYIMIGMFLDNRNLEKAEEILKLSIENGIAVKTRTMNHFLAFYLKTRDLVKFQFKLDFMRSHNISYDIHTYTMLAEYNHYHGKYHDVKAIFDKVIENGIVMTEFFYSRILSYAVKANDVKFVQKLSANIEAKLHQTDDLTFIRVLINAFIFSSQFHKIFELLDELEKKGKILDVNLYNTILHKVPDYWQYKKVLESIQKNAIVPNVITYSIMLFRCALMSHEVNDIRKTWVEMESKILPNALCYKALFAGLIKGKRYKICLDIFGNLLAGKLVSIDNYLFNAAFLSAIYLGNIQQCKELIRLLTTHPSLQKPDISIFNSLLMYFQKTGDVIAMQSTLVQMFSRHIAPDAYTAITLFQHYLSNKDYKGIENWTQLLLIKYSSLPPHFWNFVIPPLLNYNDTRDSAPFRLATKIYHATHPKNHSRMRRLIFPEKVYLTFMYKYVEFDMHEEAMRMYQLTKNAVSQKIRMNMKNLLKKIEAKSIEKQCLPDVLQ